MPFSIKKLADEIQSKLPAHKVSFDDETDHIMIENKDGTLGFCLTRKYIDDHGFDASVNHAQEMAKRL